MNSLSGLAVDEDVDVAVQVRGFVDSKNTALGPAIDLDTGDIRAQKIVDTNNDLPGGLKVLPEGRWVFPDDWWAMANYNIALRSNFDLMDAADEDDISSLHVDGIDGPFNTDVVTTDPPNVAQQPTIGPFSTLQRWSCDLMWEASATVPVDWDVMATGRNTVVPDGLMKWYDAPMPQALVTFDIKTAPSTYPGLTELLKGDLVGYGVNAVSGAYPSPYYLVEVPSSMWIPPYGYEWNSWLGVDGPYEFWDDLMVVSLGDNDPGEPIVENVEDVEVYTDNHGIAAMTAKAPNKATEITVTATADFPDRFLKGKYGPLTSDDIDIQWGVVEFNPDFEGVPRSCADVEGCSVEFVNLTVGATTPYTHSLWDPYGDGSVLVPDVAIQLNDKWTFTYQKEGTFDVKLTMTDFDGVVADQIEFDYIVVGSGVSPVEYDTWTFPAATCPDGCFVGRHLLDRYVGKVILADIDLATVPTQVQGVYYEDGTFWAPDAPGTTLAYLTGGGENYQVSVTGPCTWQIALTP
jgi:hypothetical protein